MKTLIIASTAKHLTDAFKYLASCEQLTPTCSIDVVCIGNLIKNEEALPFRKLTPHLRLISIFKGRKYFASISFVTDLVKFFFFRATRYRSIVFGNYFSNRQRWLLTLAKGVRYISLTDGAVIIYVAYLRLNHLDILLDSKRSLLKPSRIRNLTFFSKFNISTSDADSLINYSDFYKNEKVLRVEEWHFIGAPLIELQKITMENLRKVLVYIAQFSGARVKYFMHPRERSDSLAGLGDVCDIIPFEMTYEERFHAGVRPRAVVSFYSTVLFELFDYSEDLEIVFIDILDLIKLNDNAVVAFKMDLVYSYIYDEATRNNRVKVVKYGEI